MAHPKINTHPFLTMSGVPDPAKTRLEILERPGVNGQGYRDLGTRGVPFTIRVELDVSSRTVAASNMATYRGWIGDSVQVEDGGGGSWSGLTVMDVVQTGIIDIDKAQGGVAGTGAKAIMTVVFTMIGNA